MTTPRPVTIEREKDQLFITDEELVRRMGVPHRLAWAVIRDLDKQPGFPKKQSVFGDRRYWPAVRAYFDRLNGLESGSGAARVAPESLVRTRLPRRHPAEPMRRGFSHD